MTRKRAIVLGYDGSPSCESALAAAVDVAEGAAATLHIVGAWSPVEREAEVRRSLFDAVTAARERVASVGHVIDGDPTEAISGVVDETEAEIAVVGHRARGRLGRWLFGSVAESLVAWGRVPVLVVPEETVWPPRRFIVGDDGTTSARAAGDLAGRLAGWLGADVRLVAMLPRTDLRGHLDAEQHVVETGRRLRARATEMVGNGNGRRAQIQVHFAEPVEMLGRLAGHGTPACIVVGRRMRRGQVALPDSVSDALLRRPGLCVLVYPPVIRPRAHTERPAETPASVV